VGRWERVGDARRGASLRVKKDRNKKGKVGFPGVDEE